MAARTIPIRDALYERLSTLAIRQGRKVEEVADDLLTQTLEKSTPDSGRTFAEIFAPLAEDFEASNMSDEALGEFIDAEVKAHRVERRHRANEPQPNG